MSMTVTPGSPKAQHIGINMLAGELGLEILTGMKMSRNYSPLAYLRTLEVNGQVCPFSTKLAAMVWLIDVIGESPAERVNIMKVLAKNAGRRDVKKLVKRFDLTLPEVTE